jgi:hypothetical protein
VKKLPHPTEETRIYIFEQTGNWIRQDRSYEKLS